MAWEEEGIWEEDDAESDDSPIDDDEETVPCPYCRRAVLEDAERCPYCEQYISQEDAPPTGKSWWIIVAAALCLFGTAWWIFSI